MTSLRNTQTIESMSDSLAQGQSRQTETTSVNLHWCSDLATYYFRQKVFFSKGLKNLSFFWNSLVWQLQIGSVYSNVTFDFVYTIWFSIFEDNRNLLGSGSANFWGLPNKYQGNQKLPAINKPRNVIFTTTFMALIWSKRFSLKCSWQPIQCINVSWYCFQNPANLNSLLTQIASVEIHKYMNIYRILYSLTIPYLYLQNYLWRWLHQKKKNTFNYLFSCAEVLLNSESTIVYFWLLVSTSKCGNTAFVVSVRCFESRFVIVYSAS